MGCRQISPLVEQRCPPSVWATSGRAGHHHVQRERWLQIVPVWSSWGRGDVWCRQGFPIGLNQSPCWDDEGSLLAYSSRCGWLWGVSSSRWHRWDDGRLSGWVAGSLRPHWDVWSQVPSQIVDATLYCPLRGVKEPTQSSRWMFWSDC